MAKYVLLISVGPVQGFISAARKSRDLWSGSWLLSELAKAVANYLYQQSGKKENLIFPYTENPEQDLKAGSEFSVGNKIQVVVEAENSKAMAKIAEQVKQEARKAFQEIAEQAFASLKHGRLRKNVWNLQIDDYVEAQAAWAKFIDDADYIKASQLTAKVLAARKATRDFTQSTTNPFDRLLTIPKSSLDGIRETVLPEEQAELSNFARRQLDLTDSEQLDTAGIAKRLGGNSNKFTSFTRIAAHAWIDTLTEEQRKQLRDTYEALVDLKVATRADGNQGIYKDFPYDAQLLYPSRLEVEIKNSQKNSDEQDIDLALNHLQEVIKPIWKDKGQPVSYAVLLLADGDKMGELLDAAKTKEQHQAITKALSAFADAVAEKTREFAGHTIYAGGDDVLALLPLHTAYECAKALSELFTASLRNVAETLDAKIPTLSVGLAIAHIMTPLGIVRQLASQAEKVAKGDTLPKDQQRNALGITLAIRSGNTTNLRLSWNDDDAQKAFHDWIDSYQQKSIPSRIAYDTRDVHLRTAFAVQQENEHALNIQLAELKRMYERARTAKGEKLSPALIEQLNQRFIQIKKLDQLADELIVARWFAAKTQKDLGTEGSN